MKPQADLLHVVGAGTASCGLAGGLHGRQEEADQRGDDRDHHQQLHERETPQPLRTAPAMPTDVLVRHRDSASATMELGNDSCTAGPPPASSPGRRSDEFPRIYANTSRGVTSDGIGQLAIRPDGQCVENTVETAAEQRPCITSRGLSYGPPTR